MAGPFGTEVKSKLSTLVKTQPCFITVDFTRVVMYLEDKGYDQFTLEKNLFWFGNKDGHLWEHLVEIGAGLPPAENELAVHELNWFTQMRGEEMAVELISNAPCPVYEIADSMYDQLVNLTTVAAHTVYDVFVSQIPQHVDWRYYSFYQWVPGFPGIAFMKHHLYDPAPANFSAQEGALF